jgi:hypothetical protein
VTAGVAIDSLSPNGERAPSDRVTRILFPGHGGDVATITPSLKAGALSARRGAKGVGCGASICYASKRTRKKIQLSLTMLYNLNIASYDRKLRSYISWTALSFSNPLSPSHFPDFLNKNKNNSLVFPGSKVRPVVRQNRLRTNCRDYQCRRHSKGF